jgi:hypothetical protein
MKSVNVLMVAAVFALQTLGAGSVWAANDAQAQLELIAAKKAELNDHEWEVKLSSATDKSKTSSDTLIFKEQMFESKAMTDKGYKPTNYTVSLQEGGPTVWETMQSTDKGNPVFWRGEWEGDSMRGVMSKQLGDGKNEDYYFSSVSSKVLEKPVEPEPVKEEAEAVTAETTDAAANVSAVAEATLAEAQSEAAVAAPEEPKKKKGWF